MKTLLFACVHNAGRSQMAASFFNKLANPALARAFSAGTNPAQELHPGVVRVMQEIGIDLSEVVPQKLTEALAKRAQMLITMGCGESCPVIPGVQREDWPLPDPRGASLDQIRAIREEIHDRVMQLIQKKGWAYPPFL